MRAAAMLVFLAGLWLLWSGHYEPVTLGFGVVACVTTLWLALRMHTVDDEGLPVGILLRLPLYLPWLAWQLVVSNLQVAALIVSPTLKIKPQVIRVKAEQKTIIGQVIHANSITLTPGTVSLDLRDGEILVHALTDAFAAEDASGEMNRRVLALEGKG